MANTAPIRVLIAKAGLDGHDRGAKIIVRALRDAGMEVIYTGLHVSPADIVKTAIQEDVQALGVSILSGAHMTIFPKILDGLKKQNAESILVFGGGIIPDEDIAALNKLGVQKIFTPGAKMEEITGWIQTAVKA